MARAGAQHVGLLDACTVADLWVHNLPWAPIEVSHNGICPEYILSTDGAVPVEETTSQIVRAGDPLGPVAHAGSFRPTPAFLALPAALDVVLSSHRPHVVAVHTQEVDTDDAAAGMRIMPCAW